MAPLATNGGASAAIAPDTTVIVQGKTAVKEGVLKHYGAAYSSVQIGQHVYTVATGG